MSKLNVKHSISKTVLLAACLALGVPGGPLLAEEAALTEVAAETVMETENAGAAAETVTENAEAAADAVTETENTEPAGQAPLTYDYDELTVGTPTPFDGNFFTEMWGNMTSDGDVRYLVHGYDLIMWDNEKGTFTVDPSVVSGVQVTQNQEGDRTYTLTVYDDLMYCDGTRIKAADYAFSLLLEISPQMAQIGANVVNAEYIKGYEAYINGQTPSLAGLRILGDHSLSITIDHAYLPFFYEMALLDITPYPIHVIAPGCKAVDDGSGIRIVNEDESVSEPLFTADLLKQTILDETNGYLSHPAVTSGPYRLTSFDGTTATFEINPLYKGNADGVKPTIQKLVYKTASNGTMVSELAAGNFGLLNKCANVDVLQEGMKLSTGADSGFARSNYPRTGLSYISFCCERPAVSSAAIRQAVAYCLDKDQLVADYVANFGTRADGYYGLGQWMYTIIGGNSPFPVEKPAEDDKEAQKKYEEEVKAWEALNLDGVKVYDLDMAAAASLLEGDGWVLDSEGNAFDPAEDEVRCKEIGGELVSLNLSLIYPEGNAIGESLDANFTQHLKEAGIALEVQAVPMEELLDIYYNRGSEAGRCDMIYLATNFEVDFEPSLTFMPDGEGSSAINVHNVTGIDDEELYEDALAMRRTEPGNTLEYCQKWVTFQERFAEVLPMIPVYSNVYFDFYPTVLQNYKIAENVSWGQAIVEAYMSDPAETEEIETE